MDKIWELVWKLNIELMEQFNSIEGFNLHAQNFENIQERINLLNAGLLQGQLHPNHLER